ncbi:MAG TPA: hypothetical protein VFQ88_11425 [Nevskiaceae bacterium]|nr:hypothetical protein [Nevskiaceae bacterium]
MRITVPTDHSHDPYGYAARNLAPEIMQAAAGFAQAVYFDSKLSLREFEGARARIAEINGCLICQGFRAAHDLPTFYPDAKGHATVADHGPAPDEAFYHAVSQWRTSLLYSARERLAIEFAERFAIEPKVLATDEAFWSKFRAVFTDAETADLAHCVAAWLGLGRVAHVLGFDEVCIPVVHAA